MKKFYLLFKGIYNRLGGEEKVRRYNQLFDIISGRNCRRIMEIGVWNGERALQMIKTAQKFYRTSEVEYYGFDIFELMSDETFVKEVSKKPPTMAEVEAKLHRTGAQIHLFKGFTENTMPGILPTLPKMDLVFIDGGHSIETITNDWKWTQFAMNENTVVVFDDYWSGEWGKRRDAGCQSLIKGLDKTKFEIEILPIQDSFKKEWGTLKINFATVMKYDK